MPVETVLFVEGPSDCIAIEVLATRLGRDLGAEGVTVVPMGGATSVGRFVAAYGPAGRNPRRRLAGLCDVNEELYFWRALQTDAVFVCSRDLEDELIRSLGEDATEAIIEAAGELPSLRKLQQMPFHRGRPRQDHLRRFIGVRSGRKERYARLLGESVELDRIPAPLAGVLAYI